MSRHECYKLDEVFPFFWGVDDMEIVPGPVVSFYMTVKDGLPFIEQATRSVLNQTYKSWECVIVDDGSVDGTDVWLSNLCESDSRFKCIITGGVGRGKALNLALDSTVGKYVANLDADDYAHPERAAIQVEIMETNGLDFLSTVSHVFYADTAPDWKVFGESGYSNLKNVTLDLVKENPVFHSSVMMKRGAVLSVGGYSETRKSQLDYDLWLRMASGNIQLIRYQKPLVAKRAHARQSFENKDRLRYLSSSVLLQCHAIQTLGASPFSYIYPVARFLYGVIPQRARMMIKQPLSRETTMR